MPFFDIYNITYQKNYSNWGGEKGQEIGGKSG